MKKRDKGTKLREVTLTFPKDGQPVTVCVGSQKINLSEQIFDSREDGRLEVVDVLHISESTDNFSARQARSRARDARMKKKLEDDERHEILMRVIGEVIAVHSQKLRVSRATVELLFAEIHAKLAAYDDLFPLKTYDGASHNVGPTDKPIYERANAGVETIKGALSEMNKAGTLNSRSKRG